MPFIQDLTIIVSIFALAVYLWTGLLVGRARTRYNVPAPATTGPEDFNRLFRVQQNTLEQLVLFLPALWLCYLVFHSLWPALVGLLWPIGRIIYALGYARAADKRHIAFAISWFVSLGLLIAALIGALLRAL